MRASERAIAVETSDDVIAAVDFARETGTPLVIKGGGHSYFGNSNPAGSLLVWTRRMREVVFHDAFRPAGAPDSIEANPAVSVGAGAIWRDVYFPAARAGRYVQGAGCLTVGVAGFIQGGGFGSFYEANYFEPDWQDSFWGPNYDRLVRAKRAYDPGGLFRGHFYVSAG